MKEIKNWNRWEMNINRKRRSEWISLSLFGWAERNR